MPFTDKIVDEINTQLLSEIFSKGAFQGSKLFGIGYPQAVTENNSEKLNYLVTGYINGNQEDFTYDDSHPVCLYHRQLQTPVSPDAQGNFGRDSGQKETANMMLVIWGKRNVIKVHESTLASWIISTMNINFSPTALLPFQLSKASISATNINFDSTNVFQIEYKAPYPFGIEIEYFSIQYKIESSYSKGCFTTCPDC